MDKQTFDNLARKTMADCLNTLIEKAKQYAQEDRLHNFKVAARADGVTPIRALWGMYLKHWVSVLDLTHSDNPDVNIDEKINDSINYMILLKALFVERREKEHSFKSALNDLKENINKLIKDTKKPIRRWKSKKSHLHEPIQVMSVKKRGRKIKSV